MFPLIMTLYSVGVHTRAPLAALIKASHILLESERFAAVASRACDPTTANARNRAVNLSTVDLLIYVGCFEQHAACQTGARAGSKSRPECCGFKSKHH